MQKCSKCGQKGREHKTGYCGITASPYTSPNEKAHIQRQLEGKGAVLAIEHVDRGQKYVAAGVGKHRSASSKSTGKGKKKAAPTATAKATK
ncbi:MAG: hypothetical protein WC797_00380 [Candidatus Paceibacterota bacterium]|jgi:hypothetical protein